jgi:hypothetical protein
MPLWLRTALRLAPAALGGAVAHILALIRDLDDAFAGYWQVEKTAFERALKSFDRHGT